MAYEIQEYGNVLNAVRYFLRADIDKDKKILDIGTNLGSFPHQLHTLGYLDVHGIDVRDEAVRHGQQQYPELRDRLRSYNGKTMPFEDATFDVITMFDVLEHVRDVSEFLIEAKRVLKTGGVLVFQTPNIYINSVWSTLVWRSLKWKEEHCSLQSLSSLRQLLLNCGFDQVVVEKYTINTEFNQAQVRRYLGATGILLLRMADYLPLTLFPNFYGTAVKGR